MSGHAADDFGAIARRMKALRSGYDHPDGEGMAVCEKCEGGGWVLSAFQAAGAPNFETCPDCGNPNKEPSP